MSDFKCSFCGSDKQMVETPYVELNNKGEYKPRLQPCCKWTGKNMKWQKQHEDPITHQKPDLKDIKKW